MICESGKELVPNDPIRRHSGYHVVVIANEAAVETSCQHITGVFKRKDYMPWPYIFSGYQIDGTRSGNKG